MALATDCPKDCSYLGWVNGWERVCNYCLATGKQRGCDCGPGCIRYIGNKDKRSRFRKPTWDAAAGKKLWEQGMKDRQIAEALGATPNRVGDYRRRVWEKEERHGKAD